MAEKGVHVVARRDPRYPPLLKEIPDPPAMLYVRGSPDALIGMPCRSPARMPVLAVVGTRSLTRYGETATRLITAPLARAGVTIVSGLALGVDAIAHETALDARGPTVAVLGSGADPASVYPRSNARLAERIVAQGGALVSEYPPGTPAHKMHFPARNRIIAGLSRGTIVIEAPERSGALITAYAALDCGRDVFAVPGPITHPASAGTNALICAGAIPAVSADAALAHYGLCRSGPAAEDAAFDTDEERAVFAAVAIAPAGIDALAEKTGLPVRAVLAAVSTLELKGSIAKCGDIFTVEN